MTTSTRNLTRRGVTATSPPPEPDPFGCALALAIDCGGECASEPEHFERLGCPCEDTEEHFWGECWIGRAELAELERNDNERNDD